MEYHEQTIIGLSGKARSGKDTVAGYLVEIGFTRFAFADKVREFARLLGWDGAKDKKGRKLLQMLGTEVVREYDKNTWIKLLFNSPEFQTAEKIVITDMRFSNELEAVREAGGIVVRIIGRGGLEGEEANHSSETTLDCVEDWDMVIDNAGSFPELQEQIAILLTSIEPKEIIKWDLNQKRVKVQLPNQQKI